MSQPTSARFLRAGASVAATAALFAAPGIAAASPQVAVPATDAAAAAPLTAEPLLTREQEQQIEAVRRSLPPAARALVRPAGIALQQRLTAATDTTAGTASRTASVPSLADAEQAVRGQPAGRSLAAADVEAVALLVLVDATRRADHDLREAADDGKRTAAQKARLRALQARMGAAAPAPAIRRTPPAVAPLAAPRARPVLLTASLSDKDVASASPDRRTQMAADIQKDMDALNALSDQESLRLQAAMDRRAKLLETLAAILKKTAGTESAITGNLK